MLDHLSPTLVWRQLLKPLLLAIEHADARRTVHLMPTAHIEVTVELLHVHLHVGSTLRSVYHARHAMLMRGLDEVGHGINGA